MKTDIKGFGTDISS